MDKELIQKMFKVQKMSEFSRDEYLCLSDLHWEKKLSKEEVNRFWKLLWEDEKLLPKKKKLDPEEEAYRRGYSHGFHVGLNNPNITMYEVLKWRYGQSSNGGPGSYGENIEFNGCFLEEQE